MQREAESAFTLVEVMIGSSLAAVVMAAVLSSFVFLGRNLTRLANYHSLETKSRQGLTYLSRDFAIAKTIKSGTTPTSSTVTLTLPSGEVTYTYDSTTMKLRRQASFGANQDLYLLTSNLCTCAAFSFTYYTAAGGSPVSQITSAATPYSIKQVQVSFSLATPTSVSSIARTAFDAVSPRFVIRNTQLPDGT